MATAEQVLANASRYIGISGTDNIFNTWVWGFNCYDPNRYPWCACFASYVLIHDSGVDAQASASAAGIANQFQRIDDSEVQPGDIVVFNWDGRQDTGWCDHVGFVEWFDHSNGYFGTIEGNTGYSAEGEVARVTRYNYSNYFTAFFRPYYDGSSYSGGDSGYSESDEPGWSGADSGPSGAQWQGMMRGLYDTTGSGDDYAGVPGQPMLYLAIGGGGNYQVSDIHNGFWPKVDRYDLDDEENGMAGNGSPIDRVRIFDGSVKYQTHNMGGDWNPVMVGTYDTGGSSDDFAGETGVQQDLIRIWRDDGDQPEYNVYS